MSRVLNFKVIENESREELFEIKEPKKRKKRLSLEEVETSLREWKVKFEVKSSNHVKIGAINFYISTGTCYIDGMGGSFKKKGLKFLKDVLKKEGIL